MKASPAGALFSTGGSIRQDGRMAHDMYLVQKEPGGTVSRPRTAIVVV
jgi:hypothetical protein